MGLADDAYNTKPLLKLFVQIACGVVLILTGTYITIFTDSIANYIITILWVIGMMNSINMLDNMDAITASVSLSILITALGIMIGLENLNNVFFIILLGATASLIGFLFYNWNPSKLYMGDTGSQFLGILLAVTGIVFFWNSPDFNGKEIQSKQVITTLLAFLLPISDTTTVVINRLTKGQSPFIGGKDHTTHHLSYLGFSDRQVALIFIGISLISSLLILLINRYVHNWGYLHIIGFGLYALIIFLMLFLVTKRKKKNEGLLKENS